MSDCNEIKESFDVRLEENGELRTLSILKGGDFKVDGIFDVELSDMIDNDFEDFLDFLSEQLVGHVCGQNITYRIDTAIGDSTIKMAVTCTLDSDGFVGFLDNLHEDYRTICAICGEPMFSLTEHAYKGGFIGEECGCWGLGNCC